MPYLLWFKPLVCPISAAFLAIILQKKEMDEFVFDVFGGIGSYSYSAAYVNYYLKQAKDRPVRMRLSSYGGEAMEATMMGEAIRKHGNVTVEIIGKAASAATFMSFGAKSIEMHEDAFYLVHNCSSFIAIYGNLTKENIEKKIEELQNQKKSQEAVDLVISKKYMDRSGKSMEEITSLMKEDRWMTAQEAKEWGFVDTIIKVSDKKPKAVVPMEINAAFGLPDFPKIENPASPGQPDCKKFWEKFSGNLDNWFKSNFGDRGVALPLSKGATINNSISMRDSEKKVMALLGVKGFEEKDGTVTLTTAQLQMIENGLLDGETSEDTAQLQAAQSERDQFVNLINGLHPDIKAATTPEAKIAAFNAFMERIPVAGAMVKHKYNEGETNYSDVAVDPINYYGD